MLNGVPIDVCHECGGDWLDPGEISAISPLFDTRDLCSPSRTFLRSYAVLACPGCKKGSLIPHYYGKGRERVALDVCSGCGGMWVDARVMRTLGDRREVSRASSDTGVPEREPDRITDGLRTGRIAFPRRPREWFVALTGMPLDVGNPCKIIPFVTLSIIFVNVAVHVFLWHFSGDSETLLQKFAFTPAMVADGKFYPLVTAMFLHANIFHLAGNLFFLYIFGDNLEERYGVTAYLLLYFGCGVAAGALSCLFSTASTPELPHIGASGAISGVLGAYLVSFPRTRILMGIPFIRILPLVVRAPVWIFLGFWVLFNFMGWSEQEALDLHNVDYVAHLAGFVAGLAWGGLLVIMRQARLEAKGSRSRVGH